MKKQGITNSMWQIIKNELTYNKILNVSVVFLFLLMLVIGVIDGKFAGEADSNIRIFELCALFAYLTELYTKKRPQRDPFFRLLPIKENQTAIADILITAVIYLIMICLSLFVIFLSQGRISSEELIRAFSDFSLLIILMSVTSINKDLVTYNSQKFLGIKVRYFIFPGVVLYIILVLTLTNLYVMDTVEEIRITLGGGFYPVILFLLVIPFIYLRIIIYKNREQYTKSFFLSFFK